MIWTTVIFSVWSPSTIAWFLTVGLARPSAPTASSSIIWAGIFLFRWSWNGTSQKVHLQALVEDDIAVCYVNHTAALSVRLQDLLKNRRWGFFAADGKLQVKNLRVFTRKNETDTKLG